MVILQSSTPRKTLHARKGGKKNTHTQTRTHSHLLIEVFGISLFASLERRGHVHFHKLPTVEPTACPVPVLAVRAIHVHVHFHFHVHNHVRAKIRRNERRPGEIHSWLCHVHVHGHLHAHVCLHVVCGRPTNMMPNEILHIYQGSPR